MHNYDLWLRKWFDEWVIFWSLVMFASWLLNIYSSLTLLIANAFDCWHFLLTKCMIKIICVSQLVQVLYDLLCGEWWWRLSIWFIYYPYDLLKMNDSDYWRWMIHIIEDVWWKLSTWIIDDEWWRLFKMIDSYYWWWMMKNIHKIYWWWMMKNIHMIYWWWMIHIIDDEWFWLLKMNE
jgi:hypothetical protein